MGFLVLNLGNAQKIKLKAITLGSLSDDSFIFITGNSNNNDDIILSNDADIAIIVAGGISFLGACYTIYAVMHHIWPFIKSGDRTNAHNNNAVGMAIAKIVPTTQGSEMVGEYKGNEIEIA